MSFLPQRVKVGYADVSVEFVNRLTDDAGQAICGSFNEKNLTIQIDSMFQGARLVDTFLHECIHAMFYIYGWASTSKHKEESVAHCLGFGLVKLLQDNPGLGDTLDDMVKADH